jgi:hypothetical protein
MSVTKLFIALGFVGAMFLGGVSTSGAAGLFAQGTAIGQGVPISQDVRYRRGYRAFGFVPRRGFERRNGWEDPRRTHRPFDAWDRYGKRWD